RWRPGWRELRPVDVVTGAHDAHAENAIGVGLASAHPEGRLRVTGERLLVDVEAAARIDRRTVDRALPGQVDVELTQLRQVAPHAVERRRVPGGRERRHVVAAESGVQQLVVERHRADWDRRMGPEHGPAAIIAGAAATRCQVPVESPGSVGSVAVDVTRSPLQLVEEADVSRRIFEVEPGLPILAL